LNEGSIYFLNVVGENGYGEKWCLNALLTPFVLVGMRLWRLGRVKRYIALFANWLCVQPCTTFGSIIIISNFVIGWILRSRFFRLFAERLVQGLWGKAKGCSDTLPLMPSFVKIGVFLGVLWIYMAEGLLHW
jgi:hypothetical protein